jgi:hypothetical protein
MTATASALRVLLVAMRAASNATAIHLTIVAYLLLDSAIPRYDERYDPDLCLISHHRPCFMASDTSI